MEFRASWVLRGYFDFSSEDPHRTPTQAIRSELALAIGLPAAALRICSYPVGPAWRHTFWWREGESDYAEAQFFAQIAHYPVLSLGVSVEKGREDADAPGEKLMDRRSWDWQRFVNTVAYDAWRRDHAYHEECSRYIASTLGPRGEHLKIVDSHNEWVVSEQDLAWCQPRVRGARAAFGPNFDEIPKAE